ncbi:MAG: hypothetical protein Ta2B_18650 [Termitinemataceae bacterium]|nr:MAG: hypothetical protein Ta2B_18650 [Termitinemataceae bacterium]
MTIGRLDPLDSIQPVKQSGKVGQTSKTNKSDSVSISNEAMQKADLFAAVEIVKSAPDVRADRVAELKAKINDPNYITEALLRGTVDKLIDVLWPNSGDGPLNLSNPKK